MDEGAIRNLVAGIKAGEITANEAVTRLRAMPFNDMGFAKVDHHRTLRTGWPEAVYGPGKSAEQCAAIAADLLAASHGPVVLTRASKAQVDAATSVDDAPEATVTWSGDHATVVWRPYSQRSEKVCAVAAGTADLPVLDECVAVLRAYGFAPSQISDAGVAGIHRLLPSAQELQEADVVIVAAGMEGALASVVGGLTDAPVIAVPTSVGYGAALEGVTALLAMHASCAAGVTVVGIDNGFGAAAAAARILGAAPPNENAP